MKMDLEEVVMKLTGPISATGDHSVDTQRLENLTNLTKLVDQLLGNISFESNNRKSNKKSVKDIGLHATKFLQDVRAAIEDDLGDGTE